MQRLFRTNIRRWRCVAFLAFAWIAPALRAAEEAHGAEGGGIASQLHLDPQIILAQAIGFLVMFGILWVTVFRRVGGLLDKRRETVVGMMDQMKRDQADLARLKDEAHQHLIEAEQEALRRLNASVEEAARVRDDLLEQAHRMAAEELARARETIERETQAALVEIRTIVADLVVQATGKILEEELDARKHRRLIDAFIERLPGRAS